LQQERLKGRALHGVEDERMTIMQLLDAQLAAALTALDEALLVVDRLRFA
jgi:hypothetical protein